MCEITFTSSSKYFPSGTNFVTEQETASKEQIIMAKMFLTDLLILKYKILANITKTELNTKITLMFNSEVKLYSRNSANIVKNKNTITRKPRRILYSREAQITEKNRAKHKVYFDV